MLDVPSSLKGNAMSYPVLVVDGDKGFFEHVGTLGVVPVEGTKFEKRDSKAEYVSKERDKVSKGL